MIAVPPAVAALLSTDKPGTPGAALLPELTALSVMMKLKQLPSRYNIPRNNEYRARYSLFLS